MQKQWKDLFNEKPIIITSPPTTYDIINNHLKLLKSPIYIKESIPNSVIKKSRKDAYKK